MEPPAASRMNPVTYIVTLVVLVLAILTLLYEVVLKPAFDRMRTPRRLGRGEVAQDPRVVEPIAVAPPRARREPTPRMRLRRFENSPSESVEEIPQELDYRSDRQRLMDEQQFEYAQSLAADQEKERKADADCKAKMEEERRLADERRKKEEEAAAALISRKQREEALPAEADAGFDVATIVFRLGDGRKITRRFRNTEPAQHLFDFLEVKCGVAGQQNITCEQSAASIHSLGLHPQAVLFVAVRAD